MSNWEEFYASYDPPTNFEECKDKLKLFCNKHESEKIVLVTSGGTTVPLEHNTVRFVDNFSAGTRGSASAEYFLEDGYNVIFLYRLKSMEPFVRHFMGQHFLDTLTVKDEKSDFSGGEYEDLNFQPKIEVSQEFTPKMLPILRRYQAAMSTGRLLCIDFTTLSDYLWLLREACQQLSILGPGALLYLAAAVSDFYIPANKMPQHKMQSGLGAPKIQLELVPKMLAPLVSLWVPYAFVVSFKLETDAELLIPKARQALDTYKHQLVIANVLSTRKTKVTIVETSSQQDIELTPEEILLGSEIEEKIVIDVSRRHETHINSACLS